MCIRMWSITTFDGRERVRYKYDERSNLQLISEHWTPLKSAHVRDDVHIQLATLNGKFPVLGWVGQRTCR